MDRYMKMQKGKDTVVVPMDRVERFEKLGYKVKSGAKPPRPAVASEAAASKDGAK